MEDDESARGSVAVAVHRPGLTTVRDLETSRAVHQAASGESRRQADGRARAEGSALDPADGSRERRVSRHGCARHGRGAASGRARFKSVEVARWLLFGAKFCR